MICRYTLRRKGLHDALGGSIHSRLLLLISCALFINIILSLCVGCARYGGFELHVLGLQIVVAVGVVAVPSGLIANGFSQVLEARRTAKHEKRRAAAVLLQRQVWYGGHGVFEARYGNGCTFELKHFHTLDRSDRS